MMRGRGISLCPTVQIAVTLSPTVFLEREDVKTYKIVGGVRRGDLLIVQLEPGGRN